MGQSPRLSVVTCFIWDGSISNVRSIRIWYLFIDLFDFVKSTSVLN